METENIKGLELAQKIREILDNKHGEDIAIFDVKEISALTDYMIVTSGSSSPHLKAMFDDVQRVLKGLGVHCYRRSGMLAGGWLLLDYVDVVIHIFSRERREYYAIEELWAEAPRVS